MDLGRTKTRTSLLKVRRYIINSIRRPDFIINDEIWLSVSSLVYLFLDGVVDYIQHNDLIESICIDIERTSKKIKEFVYHKMVMYIWIWLSELVESWIEFAIENEEYEIAANLQNIISQNYI